jgi:diguanylate cyclase (GGDEF)-like protein
VDWFDYLLVVKFTLLMLLVLGVGLSFSKTVALLGRPTVMVIGLSIALLLFVQGLQLYGRVEGAVFWLDVSEHAFELIRVFILCALVWGLWLINLRVKQYQQTDEREQWLMQVYDNMSAAIFIIQDGSVVYRNNAFIALQKKTNSENPFSNVRINQKEIWLKTENSDRMAFWLDQFALANIQGQAFIATDITAVKLQGSIIQKAAKDLNTQNKTSIKSILTLIHEFIPSSVLYVGEYNADSNGYRYITHEGEAEGYIYSDTKINVEQFKDGDWTWFDIANVSQDDIPRFVRNSGSSFYGGILLRDDLDSPLGVILVMGVNKGNVSDLLLDFLSIFSIRVRSELNHRQDKRQIEQSSHRYRAFIESSNEAIADLIIQPSVYIDDSVNDQWKSIKKNASLKEVNPAFIELFGFTATPTTQEFIAIKSLKNLMQYVLDSGYSNEVIEVAHENSSGDIRWLSCNFMADIKERRLYRVWIILRDITDSKNQIQRLEYQNRHDNLTGLANRVALREYLDDKIDQASQFELKAALVLIDLDRFKEVNDALGHQYGDVLLKKIEPRLREIITQKRAFLARLGGDEFAIVVPSIESTDEIGEMAFEIVKKMREPFDLGQLNVEIGCSIGIAFYPDHAKQASNMMRCADVAMYKAKKDTSRVLYYRSEMDESSPRRLALMADMNKGLRENEFFLVFQPKLDLKTNEIHAAEALLRWQHRELGLVNPAEFIPLAEMSDVIIDMTHWVVEQALGQIKNWMNKNIYIKTSVNVSTRNLLNDDLPGFIKSKLDEYNVPSHLLEIEITESALMADPERALNTLKQISDMGVSISVDDFGTGYSSFIYLRQLPVDALKIDIMFVRNMCANKQDEIIVHSIINLAHNLSLTVIAEGAEDKNTIERLALMQCNMAQGYFVSKPVLPDAFIELKKTWGKNRI